MINNVGLSYNAVNFAAIKKTQTPAFKKRDVVKEANEAIDAFRKSAAKLATGDINFEGPTFTLYHKAGDAMRVAGMKEPNLEIEYNTAIQARNKNTPKKEEGKKGIVSKILKWLI